MPIPKERLAEIEAIPEAEIDTSDIPEMDGKPEKPSPYHRSSLT